MATFLNDTFTDTNGVVLSAHAGETGATWVKNTALNGGDVTINTNRIYCSATPIAYYASGTPASADYTVTATIYFASTALNAFAAVCGRQATGAATMYGAHIDRVTTGGGQIRFWLASYVAGTQVVMSPITVITPAAASSHTVKLIMVGDQISATYDDTVVVHGPYTNTAITAAGKAGVRFSGAATTSTGFHIDDISAADPAAVAVPPLIIDRALSVAVKRASLY